MPLARVRLGASLLLVFPQTSLALFTIGKCHSGSRQAKNACRGLLHPDLPRLCQENSTYEARPSIAATRSGKAITCIAAFSELGPVGSLHSHPRFSAFHCIAAANFACTHRGFWMKNPWLPGNGHGVKLALPGSARFRPIASARSYVHCVKMSS
jgi:hypothetical protein